MSALKNVWILGGTGYIGRALVSVLSGKPGIRLNLLLHKQAPYKYLEHANVFTGSLRSFDLNWLKRYPPSVIFHMARLAGSSLVMRYLRSTTGARSNRRLLDFLIRENLNPVIVYVSGSLMYGVQTDGTFADENTPLNPVSYARIYYRAEFPFIEAQAQRMADIRFARPGWILGPGSWFRAFYWQPYLKKGRIPLYGQGKQLMSLIHIDNCARQIINLAEKGKPFQNLNVFDGEPVSQNDFCTKLAGILNTDVSPVSMKKFIFKYGRTTAEALNSSVPMTTLYPRLHEYDAKSSPDTGSAIYEVVSFLKNKQRIFSESPHEGLI